MQNNIKEIINLLILVGYKRYVFKVLPHNILTKVSISLINANSDYQIILR